MPLGAMDSAVVGNRLTSVPVSAIVMVSVQVGRREDKLIHPFPFG